MRTITITRLALLAGASLSVLGGGTAFAQTAGTANQVADTAEPSLDPTEAANQIVVTGTQIQGAQINDVLPVTVVDEQQIENTGAASGDELFRSIPQAGTVAFNEQNATTVNNARGDVGSINLRDLGTGNTLLLINGRRMTLHPGFQTELLVPVVSSDTNEIAPGSVRRIEVLRDGASAIYGADAVAGVVNTVLKGNMKGGFIEADYRMSDGTSLYNYQISGGYGFDFGGGRGNLTVYGGYYHENGILSDEREYSKDDDRRRLVVGTDFEDDASFNNRNTYGPFGQFDIQAPSSRTPIGDDDFYLQPSYFPGCRLDFGNGLCARNGTTPTSDVRYNTIYGDSLFSGKNRYNAQALLNYEVSNNVEAYFEGSFYRSENHRFLDATAVLSAVPVGISRNAYWNPFGPVGSPNRLPGTTVSASGVDVIMERYRFVDAGNRDIDVNKNTWRGVIGLRGNLGSWDFDTGFVYSKAKLADVTHNRISLTLAQQQINKTTPDAYNPFNGGCVTSDPGIGDCTPNPMSSITPFLVEVYRKGGTTLALADFKISRDDLFKLPGGDLGVAAGVEWRRETFYDDRDPRLDGTITFTDSVTGEFSESDVMGTSPSPDTSGTREVYSAFAEVFVPARQPRHEHSADARGQPAACGPRGALQGYRCHRRGPPRRGIVDGASRRHLARSMVAGLPGAEPRPGERRGHDPHEHPRRFRDLSGTAREGDHHEPRLVLRRRHCQLSFGGAEPPTGGQHEHQSRRRAGARLHSRPDDYGGLLAREAEGPRRYIRRRQRDCARSAAAPQWRHQSERGSAGADGR